jgi:hypothetical protein
VKNWSPLLFCFLCFLSGCAGMRPSVEIKSEPAGAVVVSRGGENVGETPLLLETAAMEKIIDQEMYYFEVRKPGYEPRTVILDKAYVADVIELKLAPQNEGHFRTRTTTEYSKELNALARELLGIQGLLIAKKDQEAETALVKFQEQYPLVAAGYVMRANLALLRGKKNEAIPALRRAVELDLLDPVPLRMLKALEAGGAQ